MPYSSRTEESFSAATCAAKGVLLREPRKPLPPAVAQARVLPCLSVIVMMVLLNQYFEHLCLILNLLINLFYHF